MRKDVITSLLAVVALTVLLGVLYPLAVTGVSQVTMGGRADGSIVRRGGTAVGSEPIGQDFRRPVTSPDGRPQVDADGEPVLEADPRYVQSRPSVTGYAPNATAFSNRGPNATDTRDALAANLRAYLALERPYDPGLTAARVPVDAVTDSASGVDPHVSVANARIQARRIAALRRLPLPRVLDAVDDATDGRALGVLGEPGVHVLRLNLALDALSAGRPTAAAPSAATGPTTSSTTTTTGGAR
ncbi:potassium-transporting ATPase subunit C [Patulibacter americanus]|uniref:potassium-transporting ATPase subunit C n=1 Tax=Patulibacter americanus TaxID=588672 RepID=UPI0003B75912|nr:potassium-transporting ATPase subunit C [Patulibacter americanus]